MLVPLFIIPHFLKNKFRSIKYDVPVSDATSIQNRTWRDNYFLAGILSLPIAKGFRKSFPIPWKIHGIYSVVVPREFTRSFLFGRIIIINRKRRAKRGTTTC